jgi:endonuclease/exonuclease/phosphatase family metal-dependent hydrolase
MTYNIRSGRGTDNRYDLARVADVIASFDPDIVALQEVDAGLERSGGVDQASELGARLGMDTLFAAALENNGGRYGIATLTKLPTLAARKIDLPIVTKLRSEPRCALASHHRWNGGELEMFNTHLSTIFRERSGQVTTIVEAYAAEALVIAGDFNCTPLSPAFRFLRRGLRSATWLARTWPAQAPIAPIDHILYRGQLGVVHASAWRGGPARVASDHLPVVAELAYLGAAA